MRLGKFWRGSIGAVLPAAVGSLLLGAVTASHAYAAAPSASVPRIELPDFSALAASASDSVNITLDEAVLSMAIRFLDPAQPGDAAARSVIAGLKGIYIRSFTFEHPYAYPKAQIAALRAQLSGPGWSRLAQVHSSKEQSDVDVYLALDGQRANGMVVIATEPHEFTVINIVGAIDLDKLHKLEGHLGVPQLGIGPGKGR